MKLWSFLCAEWQYVQRARVVVVGKSDILTTAALSHWLLSRCKSMKKGVKENGTRLTFIQPSQTSEEVGESLVVKESRSTFKTAMLHRIPPDDFELNRRASHEYWSLDLPMWQVWQRFQEQSRQRSAYDWLQKRAKNEEFINGFNDGLTTIYLVSTFLGIWCLKIQNCLWVIVSKKIILSRLKATLNQIHDGAGDLISCILWKNV